MWAACKQASKLDYKGIKKLHDYKFSEYIIFPFEMQLNKPISSLWGRRFLKLQSKCNQRKMRCSALAWSNSQIIQQKYIWNLLKKLLGNFFFK